MFLWWHPLTQVCHAHTHIHTDSLESRLLHKEPPRCWQRQKVDFTKYTSRKMTVSPSAAVCTSRLTDGQTVGQTDRQGPVSTGSTLIQPTGGTDTSSCWSHPPKIFVQANIWFQATLILRVQMDNSMLFHSLATVRSPECPECKKVAMATDVCRWVYVSL